jgi:hypothetical protein
MQPHEMASIERDHKALLCHGKRQDIHIRYRLPGPATLGCRQDVMAEAPQSLYGGQRKVFVGIAPRHRSCRFVGTDLLLDLLSMRTSISPRVGQILSPQRRIALQEVGFTGAQTFRLGENPDGNPRANDTQLGPTDTRNTLNAGKCVSKIADDPLEELCFFRTGQCRQELLNFL